MSSSEEVALAGTRILAVDDVEAKRYTWMKILTRAGFKVVTASTGQEALDMAKDMPDLIILDVRLPDIGGMEVCRRIKDEPQTSSIPVLHISASLISPEDRATALEGGADGYLSEPVDPEELVATVNALLRMRRAEETAKKTAREWQTTFDTIQDGIVVVDSRDAITRCNRRFADIAGRSAEEIVGHPFRALMSDLGYGGATIFQPDVPNRRRASEELRWHDRWMRLTVDPIFNGDVSAGSICIISDVTERKVAEQEIQAGKELLRQTNAGLEARVLERTRRLETAIRELEAFTYTIAHDLRAPLRAMHRFSEVLVEEYAPKLETEGQEYARRIIQGAERMDVLIGDLLEYSRLSQSDLELQRLRPAEILSEVTAPLLSDSSSRLPELKIDANIPDVIGDRVLLRQVFHNLLANAVKFVAPGTLPKVQVSGRSHGPSVVLTVADNGIGISPESRDRLFRVFERLGAAKDYPGTGIGLAIVRRAMDRMGGACGVDSELGKGSRFWIRLPAADPGGA